MGRYRIVKLFFCPSPFIQMFGVFFVFVFTLLSSFVSIIKVFYFIISCSGFAPVRFFVDCLPEMTKVPLGSKTWCYNTNRRRTTQCFGVYEMMSLLGRQDGSSVTGRIKKMWLLVSAIVFSDFAQIGSSFTIKEIISCFCCFLFVLFLYLLILNIVRVCL